MKLDSINKFLQKMEEVAGKTFIILIFFITAVNIASRYFLSKPILWADEVSMYLFVWVAFLSAVAATGRSQHIKVNLLSKFFSPKVNHYLKLVTSGLMCVSFLSFFLASIRVLPYLPLAPALRIPEYYIYLILPLAFFLFITHTLIVIVQQIREGRTKR